MTVGINTPAYDKYEGTGAASLFAVNYPIFEGSNIVANVYKDSDGSGFPALELGVDFTLNGVGVPNAPKSFQLIDTGKEYLTVDGNLATGYTLFIKFIDEAFNPARFRSYGNYAPEKLDETLDRLTMIVKAVRYLASRALLMAEGGGGTGFVFPSLIGHADEILLVAANEQGFDFGPKVADIYDAKDAAQLAAQQAEGYKDAAALSASNAATALINANIAAQNAYDYSQAALLSANNAAQSESNSLSYEQSAEMWAHYYSFSDTKTLDDTDSPITIDYINDRNFLILLDTTNGNIVVNLPDLSLMPDSGWKFGICKKSSDSNTITVNAYVGQVVNGQATMTLSEPNLGVVFHDATPTSWDGDYILMGSFGGGAGSGLPPGGGTGDAIEKNSNVDGDAKWVSMNYSGFSSKWNQSVELNGLKEVTDFLIGITYAAPLVSMAATGSGTVREKGVALTTTTLTANVTKRSNAIARIRFLLSGVEVADFNPPVNTGSGATNYVWNGSIQDTATFSTQVTDEVVSGQGGNTVNASVTFNFVYPYYFGCRPPAATASQVAALTKSIIVSNANITRDFTAANGDVFYHAYPKSYGATTLIEDQNGFNVTASWTEREVTVTALDGNAVVYYVYEFNNIQVAGSATFTFKR